MQRNELQLLPHTKTNSNWIPDLSRTKTKTFREDTVENFGLLGLDKDFLKQKQK